jgi:hypothetical protein
METSAKSLEERVADLEKGKQGRVRIRFFVQYLLSPLLVLVVGLVFNWQLERSKKEIQQLQIAQSMLTTLFSEDEFKALATKRLMDEVLEDESLRREIGGIVEDYLRSKFDQSIEEGDVESAQKIFDAAKSIGGSAGQTIAREIESDEGKRETLSKYRQARDHEIKGFEALIREDLVSALANFKKAREIYPDLHNVAEIYQLLFAASGRFDRPEVRRGVYGEIVSKYSWKVPENVIQELEAKKIERRP